MYYCYSRISTAAQKETSLEVQEAFLIRQAELLNSPYRIVREIGSGKNVEGRPQLQDLIRSVTRGDIVGCYDNSRFGRNTEENLRIAREFAEKGTRVQIGGRLLDPDNPDDELSFSLESAISTYQRKNQNKKAKASIDLKRQSGDMIITGAFYGYELRRSRGKTSAIPVEEEVRNINYVFNAFIQGVDIYTISQTIKLHPNRVRNIINEPLYIGKYFIDKEMSKGKSSHPERIVEENLMNSNVYQPIVDENIFWEANRIYKMSHKPRDYSYRNSCHELTGIFHAHCCGAGYVRSRNFCYKRAYEYYAATNHRVSCTAGKKGRLLRSDYLETVSRLMILVALNSNVETAAFFSEQRDILYSTAGELRKEIKAKEKEIKGVQEKIDKLLDVMSESDMDMSLFKNKIDKLNTEQLSLKEELESMRKTLIIKEGSIDELIEAENLNSIDQFINDTIIVRRSFYERYVKSAIVYPDRFEVLFINGKKFIVYKRKRRFMTTARFDMYFNDERQSSGTFDLERGTVEFDQIRRTDNVEPEFNDWINKYQNGIAEKVNQLMKKF